MSGAGAVFPRRAAFRFCAAALSAFCLLTGGAALFSAHAAPSPAPALTVYPPEVVPAPTLPPEEYDPSYDFGAPVPRSGAVDDDWFSNAAFLGDSLTEGLLLYSGLNGTGSACLAYRGLTVKTASTMQVLAGEDGKRTVMEALASRSYDRVYLLYGVNELGWANDELYFSLYATLIDQVRALQPDAELYLQTLLPVTAEKELEDPYRSNEHIRALNRGLQALAAEKQVYLLDVHSAFAGADGALDEEGSTDGVHLTRSYYHIWLDYLTCHRAPQSGTEHSGETA